MTPSSKKTYYESKGTRKRSKARVRVYEGDETSIVNDLPVEEFFRSSSAALVQAKRPIVVAGLASKVYFTAKVFGGGVIGQSEAIQLALARALLVMDDSLRPVLKKEDLLSRDPREKERKKYFLVKARKRPQFSKR